MTIQESYAKMLETLKGHGEREEIVLGSYRHLVEQATDEGVRYLGQLIISDEERLHTEIVEMVNRIESWMKGVEIEPSTPQLSPRVDRALLDETHRLIALEREEAKELHVIKRELHDVSPLTLLPLLVGLMIQATDRHIEILQFIRSYTG